MSTINELWKWFRVISTLKEGYTFLDHDKSLGMYSRLQGEDQIR